MAQACLVYVPKICLAHTCLVPSVRMGMGPSLSLIGSSSSSSFSGRTRPLLCPSTSPLPRPKQTVRGSDSRQTASARSGTPMCGTFESYVLNQEI